IPIVEAIRPQLVASDVPTVTAARETWAEIARQTDAYLNSLTEKSLREDVSWSLPGGPSGVTPRWQFLLHLADHGTHTRGQIVAASRRAGHPCASVGILGHIFGKMVPGGECGGAAPPLQRAALQRGCRMSVSHRGMTTSSPCRRRAPRGRSRATYHPPSPRPGSRSAPHRVEEIGEMC